MMVRAGCSNTSFRPQFITKLQHADLDMLKLPSEFMMHVEDENTSRSFATVLSPIGKTCNIKLNRDQSSETFLKGGWPEFSKIHKLEVGFKLVFRYEGNMVFNVKVFGLNGCLKDYNQGAVKILRRIGFNASIEQSPAKCATDTEGSTSSGKQTKRKYELVIEKETPHDRSKMREEIRTATNSYVEKKKKYRTTISASHQTLITRMTHCNIHKFLTLRKIFGSVPPYNLEKGEITVKNEKQEIWKVRFKISANYNSLCGGWKQFCWKNNIKCGDISTLEIIAKNEILVTISKAAKTVETIDVKSEV